MRTHSLVALLLATGPLVAQTPVTIQLTTFATGIPGIVDIAHAGDERIFVVQREGYIRIVGPTGTLLPTPFLDITGIVQDTGGEQGLLGLAFDPDHATNGFFYVNYTGSGGTTRIARYGIVPGNPDQGDPASAQILYSRSQPFSNHNAGDLDFGPDGYLYIPLGDGGSGGDPQNNAQDLSDALGDIVRIDVSDPEVPYTVPPDNPFVNAGADTLPEIWGSGLRNPWRFGFDALTGDMWIGDVGQNAYEEVDYWPLGGPAWPNFGWRCYEGNAAYNTAGCGPFSSYVAPVSVHLQSTQNWCSVIGGRVYRGDVSQRLFGRYIYTDHCGGQFYSLHPDEEGGWVREQVRNQSVYGYTCIGENSDLELFVGNMNNGILYRIIDPCPMDAPLVSVVGNVLTSSEATSYQWYFNGAPIDGATEQTLVAVESGNYYVVAGVGAGCELASAVVEYVHTGIGTLEALGIRVYPVPATDRLVVEGGLEQVVAVELMDLAGRIVMTVPAGITGRVTVPVGAVANGRYQVVLRAGDGARIGQQSVAVLH